MIKGYNKTQYIQIISITSIFSYAVLYSSLSLYFTSAKGFSITQSNSIVGIFIAFNFLLHLFAGIIGDKLISNKNLLMIALIFQTIGGFILASFINLYLFEGLCFFLIGCGFTMTCLNSLLMSELEFENQEIRERGFFINYTSMNFGFFMGFLASGYCYSISDFHLLFQICHVFNIMAFFLSISLSQKINKSSPKFFFLNMKGLMGLACIFILYFCMLMAFNFKDFTNHLLIVISVLPIISFLIYAILTNASAEKKKIFSFLIFVLSAIVFWTLYFIGPMGLMFFLKNNVNRTLFNFLIPPQWFMNFETILIIVGGPLLIYVFRYLGKKNISISSAKKFSWALISISLAYFILIIGITNADVDGLINKSWIVLYYILQAIGELLLAPVGLAMIGKLAPKKLRGVMLGIWMMVCGVSSVISHYISNAMSLSDTQSPLLTNHHYVLIFSKLSMYAFITGTILFLLTKKIDLLTQTNEENFKLSV